MFKHCKRTAALLLFALLLFALVPAQAADTEAEWFNFLLIGTDTRKDEANAGRSDTIIICSVNLTEGRMKLTSMARDMWVDIAGERGWNKLNAAHSYGGPELLMQTLNETFSLDLAYYVSINFYGLMDIVEALGGVTLEISSAEAGQINQRIQQEFADTGTPRAVGGYVTLDGVQALCFTRIRNLDSDFGRTERQRRLLTAMLGQVRQASMPELFAFAGVCMEHCTTNLGLDQLTGMALSLLSSGMDSFEELSLPSGGNYQNETIDGHACLVFDPEQVAQELHTFIYGSPAH